MLNRSGYSFPLFSAAGLHKILRSKGIYPYRWVDSIEKFNETTLPPKEWFDNDLTGEKCSDERYNKALEVWRALKCSTFKDYHDAYLKSDVVLLADVVNNYREKCMKMFQLDPARFVSVQSMTMTNWLKFVGKPIGVLSNNTMYEFFHSAIRGGMCSVGELTYANVYGKNDEVIIGFDMNALYPTAMIFPLPCGDFQWVDVSEAWKA
jgi:hypothetical protein